MFKQGGEHKQLKRIIFFGLALIIYIFLSSTIYNANQEIKVSEFLIRSTMNMANIRDGHIENVIKREKELTSEEKDSALAERLKGKILLQIEANGSAWYLHPVDLKRYYLGRPNDAMLAIKELSKEMSAETIVDYIYFEKKFPLELSGRFIKNKDDKKLYYYIIPETRLAIPLKTPNEAFRLLRDLGLGITNESIRKISVGEI